MRITIVAVGQRQPAWADAAVNEYLSRLPADFKVELKQLKAEPRTGSVPLARLLSGEARAFAPRCRRLLADRARRARQGLDDAAIGRSPASLARLRQRRCICDRRRRRARSRPETRSTNARATFKHDATARSGESDAGRATLSSMVNVGRAPVSPRLVKPICPALFISHRAAHAGASC